MICNCLSIKSFKFRPYQHVKSVDTKNSCPLIIFCQSYQSLCSSSLSWSSMLKCVMSKSDALSDVSSCQVRYPVRCITLSSASPGQGSVYLAVPQFCELFSFVSISTASDYIYFNDYTVFCSVTIPIVYFSCVY